MIESSDAVRKLLSPEQEAKMAHYGGGIPVGYQPEDTHTVVVPEGAVPARHPDVQRKIEAGWKLGETRRHSSCPGHTVVYLYPPGRRLD